MKKTTSSTCTSTLSLRQAKTRFSFAKERDDLNLKGLTCRIFTTYSPILEGGRGADVGVYGAPVGVLVGYQSVKTPGTLLSVKPAEGDGAYVLGRLVEVTMDELAQLDAVAELCGDYHRFEADVKTSANSHSFKAWVFQLLSHATPNELDASATKLGTTFVRTRTPKITTAQARVHSLPLARPHY